LTVVDVSSSTVAASGVLVGGVSALAPGPVAGVDDEEEVVEDVEEEVVEVATEGCFRRKRSVDMRYLLACALLTAIPLRSARRSNR
jgi:hypothetical protein